MRQLTLKTLTWGTVTAAVGSALWLAAIETDGPDARKAQELAGTVLPLPKEPPAAGPLRAASPQDGRPRRPGGPGR